MNKKIRYIKGRYKKLREILTCCKMCPRVCGVDRTKGQKGYCGAGRFPGVFSYQAHNGEEPPISGTRGSGTIFFSNCNLRCVYCQNYTFSQNDDFDQVDNYELAKIMVDLQRSGCHNINLVSPTHYLTQIIESLMVAMEMGLSIPVVYNTGGYDNPEAIKLLEGIVDIYMPDMRYSNDEMARIYSGAESYVKYNRACVSIMHKQVGDLQLDAAGIGMNGVLVRCLVLPENISGTTDTLRFIRNSISKNMFISLMSQYYPAYKARLYRQLSRRLEDVEYIKVYKELKRLQLDNGWIQAAPSGMDLDFAGETYLKKRAKGG